MWNDESLDFWSLTFRRSGISEAFTVYIDVWSLDFKVQSWSDIKVKRAWTHVFSAADQRTNHTIANHNNTRSKTTTQPFWRIPTRPNEFDTF